MNAKEMLQYWAIVREDLFKALDQVSDDELFTKIDEESLREIARLTKGKYYRATDGQALASIYGEIGEMEKTEIKTKEYIRYTELFWFFLLPAIVLLGGEIVLANTRFRKIP